MPERVVTVRLSAQVANYVAGMEKATKATRETGSEAEKLAQKREAFELLGRTAFVMGSVIAAGVGLAIVKASEFDQAMSNVNAVMQETTENQKLLRQAALDFGASSVFTATESANAIEELGKAGLSTADILGGALKGSLNLASAGQLEIARAAEIAATTLAQFGLDGSQASRVADTLAAGAGKALGSVEDLAQGLKFVGPVAADMGVSLEETTAVLALFAKAGLVGEQGGTSLRGMLASLTSPSSLARKEIEKLGITLYDQQGAFLGLENAAGELQGAFGGMTDAQRDASLGILFGNQQITGARVLYRAGADGVDEMTKSVTDNGYAARVAADRLDNLRGDVEQLGGAFDTALITTGSAANDVLRTMAQTLTNLLDLYNAAPEPVKAVALAVGALAAVALLAGGAFFLGVPQVAKFTAALATMGPTAQRAGALLTAAAGPIGIAFVVAGAAVAIWAGAQATAKARTDAFSDTINKQTGVIQDSTRELVKANLAAKESFLWMELPSTFDAAEKLGLGLDVVTDAALGNADALTAVEKATSVVTITSRESVAIRKELGLTEMEYLEATKKVREGVKGEADSIEEAIRITQQKASVDREATKKADEHATALGVLEGKADDTTGAVDDLADTIRGFGSATLSVRDANRNLEEAFDSLTESVATNGVTLDIAEESGRANEAALDGIAKAALEAAASTYEQTSSQEQANAVIAAGRARLIEMLAQFGITGEAAEAYVDELELIPGNIDTAVRLSTFDAQRQLNNFFARNDGRIIRVGQVAAFASGGPTGDNIPATVVAGFVHGKEFVSTARTTAIPENRRALDFMHRGGVIRGYAGGGFVQPQYVQSVPQFRMPQSSSLDQSTQINISGGVGYDPASIAREITREKRKANAGAGIGRVAVA